MNNLFVIEFFGFQDLEQKMAEAKIRNFLKYKNYRDRALLVTANAWVEGQKKFIRLTLPDCQECDEIIEKVRGLDIPFQTILSEC